MVDDIGAMAVTNVSAGYRGGRQRDIDSRSDADEGADAAVHNGEVSSQFDKFKITLTFVVPAYNMEGYLRRCVDSLTATGASDVEVIIVDDGSSDGTAKLAEELAAASHGCANEFQKALRLAGQSEMVSNAGTTTGSAVRVVHQGNKGHGGAVNAGIAAARGTYIKVVDADDWVGLGALESLLEVLRQQCSKPQTRMPVQVSARGRAQGMQASNSNGHLISDAPQDGPVDMVVTDYVYDKVGKCRKHVVDFRHVMKPGVRLGWNDLHRFGVAQYLIMHALTFRTDVLRQACTTLPEHTFYVDFIYAYQPLPWVRSLMYLNVPLYHYFIGREGQSVQADMMVQRVDQLVRVNRIMDEATPERGTVPQGLYRYMIHFLSINSVVTSVFLILSRDPANYEIKRMLWKNMKRRSPSIAHDVRRQLPSLAINLPGATGRWIIRQGYRVANGIIGFN